jgi:hypothetical protein
MSPKTTATSELAELRRVVLAYFKQETVVPAKALGRWVAFGIVGSVAIAIGVVLALLAGLRAIQTETGTTFAGSLSWLPYVIVLVAAAGVTAAAASAALRRSSQRRSKDRAQ